MTGRRATPTVTAGRVARVAAAALVVLAGLGGCAADPGSAGRRPGAAGVAAPTTTSTTSVGAEIAPGVRRLVIAPAHPDGYDRALFSDWTDPDGDCQDTRAEILIASSALPVTFTSSTSCTVATGSWTDPWSGAVVTSARSLDIDHTVPLANAWRSGAWSWTPEARAAYAVDAADPGHLLAIPLGENRSKGDDGPESWRPPDRGSWCRYVQIWTGVKAKWSLTATPEEWAAIEEMAATC